MVCVAVKRDEPTA